MFVVVIVVVYGFGASVADIRSLIETVAEFPYKVRPGLVTGREGSALHIAEDDLRHTLVFRQW